MLHQRVRKHPSKKDALVPLLLHSCYFYTIVFSPLKHFLACLSVITEISSTNGYKNSTSPNSYDVTHGPILPQKHFQRVKNHATNDKIKVHYDETGHARTCAKHKCKKSAYALDARMWSQKAAHM
jgi:hypothetical protein